MYKMKLKKLQLIKETRTEGILALFYPAVGKPVNVLVENLEMTGLYV